MNQSETSNSTTMTLTDLIQNSTKVMTTLGDVITEAMVMTASPVVRSSSEMTTMMTIEPSTMPMLIDDMADDDNVKAESLPLYQVRIFLC